MCLYLRIGVWGRGLTQDHFEKEVLLPRPLECWDLVASPPCPDSNAPYFVLF